MAPPPAAADAATAMGASSSSSCCHRRNLDVQKPSPQKPHTRRGTRTGRRRKRNPNPGEREGAVERRVDPPSTNPTHPLAIVTGGDGRGAVAGGTDRAVLSAGDGAVQLCAAAARASARGHLPHGALRLLRALRPPGPRQGTCRGRWASPLLPPFPHRGARLKEPQYASSMELPRIFTYGTLKDYKKLSDDAVIGIHPWSVSVNAAQRYYEQTFFKKRQTLFQLSSDLVDEVWNDRPPVKPLPVIVHTVEFAGRTVS